MFPFFSQVVLVALSRPPPFFFFFLLVVQLPWLSFWLIFLHFMFFHLSIFNLAVSLLLKVCFVEAAHTWDLFFDQTDIFCLLIATLRPFYIWCDYWSLWVEISHLLKIYSKFKKKLLLFPPT